MNCRAGAGASGKGSSASIGRTSFWHVGNNICSICGSHSFAPLRVCVYLLRSTSGDSLQTIVLFFSEGNRTAGHRRSDAFGFIISGVPKVFVVLSVSSCPNLLARSPFCAPARVYNFSCFTAVVRLLFGSSLVLLLCSGFFTAFLLLFI